MSKEIGLFKRNCYVCKKEIKDSRLDTVCEECGRDFCKEHINILPCECGYPNCSPFTFCSKCNEKLNRLE